MNGEPLWLEIGEVLLIHQRMISLYGGSAGLRDPNLLESALAALRTTSRTASRISLRWQRPTFAALR